MQAVAAAPVRGLIFVIELYRHLISPLRLPSCRFMPTCSQYAVDALTEYGLIRGSWLAVVRLAKCGPWHQGGWDPIPERSQGIADCGCPSGDALNMHDNRAEGEYRVL
ncbi:membrane protein insertion efficiency factor YidD [Mycolicibacter icosiumassiliensis]|uniref:membrane protein insertion efficiency factor YidD n=1 Tax=Mycolicibacter icosiumassiliensis TaxID=1792835 RepID=UPI000835D3B5|nr:membrane protein insertion efficiency factor YidD [Mycolicibacter icosiumassiliensis]